MKESIRPIKITVVIPTHNRKKELKNLLEEIFEQKNVEKLNIAVVVVVDGSTDGTLEMLQNEFPDVQIVKGNGSWWYTKSMNRGFRYAIDNHDPDYFLTLNDDVKLAGNYFEEICYIINDLDTETIIGSLGVTNEEIPRVVTSGNYMKYKCLGVYKSHLPFLAKVDVYTLTGTYPSLTLPGRGMLIPKLIIKNLNGFDEQFKQYHSDGDFTLRAVQEGYNVCISWDLVIYVDLQKTSSSSSFLNSSMRLLIKSFFEPVSRNYLPDKSRFNKRHGHIYCYPVRMLLFIFICFRNLYFK